MSLFYGVFLIIHSFSVWGKLVLYAIEGMFFPINCQLR